MLVFGWIALILIALFGVFCIGLFIGPFIIAKIKIFGFRIKTYLDDEKLDTEKRSEERKHRDEIKRQRDFELANKKLDAKLNKVDKQIKLQTKKLELAEKLKKQTQNEKDDLQESNPSKKHDKSKVQEIKLEEPIEELDLEDESKEI